MIKYDLKNKLLIFEINYSQEKFDITKYKSSDIKNAIIDITHLNCSYPQMSIVVKNVIDYCLSNGVQNICIVTRPSLLSSIREYLRVLSGVEDVAFFNHISAAFRYFNAIS